MGFQRSSHWTSTSTQLYSNMKSQGVDLGSGAASTIHLLQDIAAVLDAIEDRKLAAIAEPKDQF